MKTDVLTSEGQQPSEATAIYLDYPKHRMAVERLWLLVTRANKGSLHKQIKAKLNGEAIPMTEQRATKSAE